MLYCTGALPHLSLSPESMISHCGNSKNRSLICIWELPRAYQSSVWIHLSCWFGNLQFKVPGATRYLVFIDQLPLLELQSQRLILISFHSSTRGCESEKFYPVCQLPLWCIIFKFLFLGSSALVCKSLHWVFSYSIFELYKYLLLPFKFSGTSLVFI